jgi:hypothetical protein
MREVFTSAKGFKPVACRAESFETYLIGINKKKCLRPFFLFAIASDNCIACIIDRIKNEI